MVEDHPTLQSWDANGHLINYSPCGEQRKILAQGPLLAIKNAVIHQT